MVLVFLPIVGFFIYLFLGRSLKEKNFYQLTEEEQNSIASEVDQQLVAKQLQELFLKDIELSSELTPERYQERALLIKFKEGISRLLSPIL